MSIWGRCGTAALESIWGQSGAELVPIRGPFAVLAGQATRAGAAARAVALPRARMRLFDGALLGRGGVARVAGASWAWTLLPLAAVVLAVAWLAGAFKA